MSRKRTERPPGSPYITPEGARKLNDEFDYLWNVDRPRVAEAVRIAAAQGDRSENADYQYGKQRLREIDTRVEFLDRRLKELKIVDPVTTTGEEGRVTFGAWIRLEDEDGEETLYRIVGPDEFDPAQGYISMDSPVGRALLGKEAGSDVRVRRPKGDIEYTIVEVSRTRFERQG
jgi:transcription elongation factor GreB